VGGNGWKKVTSGAESTRQKVMAVQKLVRENLRPQEVKDQKRKTGERKLKHIVSERNTSDRMGVTGKKGETFRPWIQKHPWCTKLRKEGSGTEGFKD